MIRAVIFDFDHTLYDRRRSSRAAVPALQKRLAAFLRPDVSLEQLADAVLQAETSVKNHGGAGYQGIVDDIDAAGYFAVKPTRMEYLNAFYPSLAEHIIMRPDAYDMLDKLRADGYKTGLLTNGAIEIQRLKLSYTRIPECMDVIIIGDELPHDKPHPYAFIEVCRRLGVRPDEAVYVGDQPIIDMCGARGAGMKTIWTPFVNNWPADVPPADFTADTLSKIIDILKTLA